MKIGAAPPAARCGGEIRRRSESRGEREREKLERETRESEGGGRVD